VTATVPTLPPASTGPSGPRAKFANGSEWHAALGGVPLERVLFDPWPGTATEADVLRLVETGKRLVELVDGTLVEKPVGYLEALIAMRIGARLTAWADEHDAGAVTGADSTLRMTTGQVRLPDVSFFSKDRLAKIPVTPVLALAPDLAVEVLSATNTTAEMRQKRGEYFQSGTTLVWIVDPADRSVSVYRSAQPDVAERVDAVGTLTGDPVLPGFKLPVGDIFRNVPPYRAE
jgi:Uma2 family endonuclease